MKNETRLPKEEPTQENRQSTTSANMEPDAASFTNASVTGFFIEKTDDNGIPYLFTDYAIVTRQDVMTYAGDQPELPSIFNGLPIDTNTLSWNEDGELTVTGGFSGGGGTGLDETAMWDALNVEGEQQINQSHISNALNDYFSEKISGNINDIEAAIRDDMQLFDESTLSNAKQYTDQREAVMRSDQDINSKKLLQEAKDYAKTVAASVVDNAPEALDTLKELSAALGNDPNFATTVMTEIGKKVTQVQGKVLSSNDYTNADKTKLAGIVAGANNYAHPGSHPASMIVQDNTRMFVTESEKTAWNGKANASHSHNYLPLTGGTITGSLKASGDISVGSATEHKHFFGRMFSGFYQNPTFSNILLQPYQTGNVGIGSFTPGSEPTERLHVSGNILATGNISMGAGHNIGIVMDYPKYSWGGNQAYPCIHGTTVDRHFMMTFPHVPYLEKNQNSHTGTTYGAIMRFAGQPAANSQWDIGTGHLNNVVGRDSFGISRNNVPVMSYSIDNMNDYRYSTWRFSGDIVSKIPMGYASVAENLCHHSNAKFIGMTPDAVESVLLIAPYTGNQESWRGINGKLYIHRGNATAFNRTSSVDIAISKAYASTWFQAHCFGTYDLKTCLCTYNGIDYIGVAFPKRSSMDITFSGIYSGNCVFQIVKKSDCANFLNLNSTAAFQVQGDISATGNILANGAITAKATSDRRLKNNFREIDANDLLLSLGKIRSFDYNEKAKEFNANTPDSGIGLVYQQAVKILPGMSAKQKDDKYGSLNYLHTDYINLIGAATQQNHLELNEVKKELIQVKKELAGVITELAKYKPNKNTKQHGK